MYASARWGVGACLFVREFRGVKQVYKKKGDGSSGEEEEEEEEEEKEEEERGRTEKVGKRW